MQINTGKGTINALTVVAIWSLSLAVNLPGLAVSPMLDQLKEIFGDVSRLEVQLLTVMPNIFIIPFVLWSGRLSLARHKILIVIAALIIYALSGILYLLSSTIIELILISCLLGIGCGLLIPFSTGLIADVFVGKYRMRQMGISSALGNVALVVATFVVGLLAARNWHLPFVVYLIPLVSLVLAPWLKKIPQTDLNTTDATAQPTPAGDVKANATIPAQGIYRGFYTRRIVVLCCVYFFFMFVASTLSYNLPFLMQGEGLSTTDVGTVTAVFFLGMFVVGLALTPILRGFRTTTFICGTASMMVGFGIFALSHSMAGFVIGAIFLGFGNGTLQPIIFDKATETVISNSRSTLALAFIQTANYLAISLTPVIVDLFRWIFGDKTNAFPFWLAAILTAGMLLCVIIWRKRFVFVIKPSYY